MIISHIKTIRGIVVKGFAKIDERFNKVDEKFNEVHERFGRIDCKIDRIEENLGKLDKKVDETKIELKQDIEDLAGMTAREFKAVRSEISHRNLLQDA